ncbi:MAG: phosphoglycolate phosphatase [Gammaproteobacteria bacterium]|nr:phosphoglycolate phosphatase [Gammaproteobacteria bacterium]
MSYSAYLFDLDGTLVDTAPDLSRALNHTLAGAGFAAVDESLTRHWVGHGVRAMLEAAFHHLGRCPGPEDLDRHQAALLEHYAAHIADYSLPYPSVVETLAVLAERAPLAVVTNKPTDLSNRLLAALDLARFFRVVVGRGTTRRFKPDPAPALYACEHVGMAPEQALFVGDSETDVLCARAAGCPVVLYRYGYNHGKNPDHLGADRVIDSFDALV